MITKVRKVLKPKKKLPTQTKKPHETRASSKTLPVPYTLSYALFTYVHKLERSAFGTSDYTIYFTSLARVAAVILLLLLLMLVQKVYARIFSFTYESIIHTVLTVFINYCHVSSEKFLRLFFHLLSCVNAAAI